MKDKSELVYMDRQRVHRALKRMAYQVAEDNRENKNICLVGIEHRGFAIASHLAGYLSDIYSDEFPVLQLQLEQGLKEKDKKYLTAGSCYLLVIDDVIFSGKTMFRALNIIYKSVTFSEIHTAVLIDRGHRTFPVQAQFVGLELSTKLNEHVSVYLEKDDVDKVILEMD